MEWGKKTLSGRRMDEPRRYREELKYVCKEATLQILEERLKALLLPDRHGNEENIYNVHSLYFDDYTDSCYFDNNIGTNIRFKYRIRYYDDCVERISLERKEKRNGLCRKIVCSLTKEEYDALYRGDVSELFWQTDNLLLKQFSTQIMNKRFEPKIIVSYERKAYVMYAGNVRITLDRNISASDELGQFCANDFGKRPVLPAGTHLLEVKYDDYLPDFVKKALNVGGLTRTAFSKYNICRQAIQIPRRRF